jgi:hypothetical protein
MRENSIQNKVLGRKISVAPMMDWTDRANLACPLK